MKELKKKILCTCPPMILQIDHFKERFAALGWDVHCPAFQQVLSVDELKQLVGKYDGWIIGDDPACDEVFEAGRDGALVAAVKWGAGVDNVDFDAARKQGIPICNTPGTFAEEVSDAALGYVIGLARGLFQIDRGVRNLDWPKPVGSTLRGKTAGVVGLGHIGRTLVRKLDLLGLDVIGYDPYVSTLENTKAIVSSWAENIEKLDFLILCCSLTNENRYMINEGILREMKSSSFLVNVGRGPLVNEAELVVALREGEIAGAALEVMEEEPLPQQSALRNLDNVVFGSHNSSNTREAVLRTSEIAIEHLLGFLLNEK